MNGRPPSFGDLWVIVPNWNDFQHYKDRDPPWIRVYTDLLRRPEWLDLSPNASGLLLDVWLAFAAQNGQLRVKDVSRLSQARVRRATFERLADAGFIELSASKPLPQRQRQRHIPRAVTSKADDGLGFEIPKDLLRDVPR